MNNQSMQLALEVRNPLLHVVSTFGIEKDTSPTFTLKMAAKISFVSLVRDLLENTEKLTEGFFTLEQQAVYSSENVSNHLPDRTVL